MIFSFALRGLSHSGHSSQGVAWLVQASGSNGFPEREYVNTRGALFGREKNSHSELWQASAASVMKEPANWMGESVGSRVLAQM
jgi:hypothetical protein